MKNGKTHVYINHYRIESFLLIQHQLDGGHDVRNNFRGSTLQLFSEILQKIIRKTISL